MNLSITVYNAFTGMSPSERQHLLPCIHAGHSSPQSGEQALDYALKQIPSFGGFVLVASRDVYPVGYLIVGKTGMEGFGPGYVIAAMHLQEKGVEGEQLRADLLGKARELAGGDLAVYENLDRWQLEHPSWSDAPGRSRQMPIFKPRQEAIA